MPRSTLTIRNRPSPSADDKLLGIRPDEQVALLPNIHVIRLLTGDGKWGFPSNTRIIISGSPGKLPCWDGGPTRKWLG